MNYPDITAHATRVGARRVILTHMSPDMLARVETAAACVNVRSCKH